MPPPQPENPWLKIPARDYEGHMASPGVRQLQYLNQALREVLVDVSPATVAILGCATGNGLEHVDPRVTRLAVGVDINTRYLRIAASRLGRRRRPVTFVCADVSRFCFGQELFDLIGCALVLEYVEPGQVVPACAAALRAGGTLSVILQLPAPGGTLVSESQYRSLRCLEPAMNLVDPGTLRSLATEAGLTETVAAQRTLASGKRFWQGRFCKAGRRPGSPGGEPSDAGLGPDDRRR
jgi:hypothetical protein